MELIGVFVGIVSLLIIFAILNALMNKSGSGSQDWQTSAERPIRQAEAEAKRNADKFAEVKIRLNDLIQQHVKTLAVKLQQLTTKDAYGVMDVSAFSNEVD